MRILCIYLVLAVSASHPDKCADIIVDSIVDALLQLKLDSKATTEVFISAKHIIIGGKVKSTVLLEKGRSDMKRISGKC